MLVAMAIFEVPTWDTITLGVAALGIPLGGLPNSNGVTRKTRPWNSTAALEPPHSTRVVPLMRFYSAKSVTDVTDLRTDR